MKKNRHDNSFKKTICSRGHTFYKKSDCPVCPFCWPGRKKQLLKNSGLPVGIAAPALRAHHRAGIKTLGDCANRSESQLLALHGIGPSTTQKLRDALKKGGLTFKE
jgi:hypothetical protein